MEKRPRDRAAGIFTRPVVALILLGGIWSAIVNTSLFGWAVSTDRTTEEAVTLVFASLALIEFFKAYSYRSERRSVLRSPFANRWLNVAIVWELALLALVIHLPFLQGAFGTTGLAATEWLLAAACAVSILPVLEAGEWVVRGGVVDPRGPTAPGTLPGA